MPPAIPDEYAKYMSGLEKAYDILKAENAKLNLILFHRENGLSHPDLKGEIAKSKMAHDLADALKANVIVEADDKAEKVIQDMDFQSGCSWCEKNNEIRNKYEEE